MELAVLIVVSLTLFVTLLDLYLDLQHTRPVKKQDHLRLIVREGVALAERTATLNRKAGHPFTSGDKLRVALEYVEKRATATRIKHTRAALIELIEAELASAQKRE